MGPPSLSPKDEGEPSPNAGCRTTIRYSSGLAPESSRKRSVEAVPAPHWFFRFVYDRESAVWERGRDDPEQRELVERTADELATVVAPPGPVADLGS